jgi:hypothetical protein
LPCPVIIHPKSLLQTEFKPFKAWSQEIREELKAVTRHLTPDAQIQLAQKWRDLEPAVGSEKTDFPDDLQSLVPGPGSDPLTRLVDYRRSQGGNF